MTAPCKNELSKGRVVRGSSRAAPSGEVPEIALERCKVYAGFYRLTTGMPRLLTSCQHSAEILAQQPTNKAGIFFGRSDGRPFVPSRTTLKYFAIVTGAPPRGSPLILHVEDNGAQ